MKFSALLTSAGVNTGLCVVLFFLYCILRRQPRNVNVYFAGKLARDNNGNQGAVGFERLLPSPTWIVDAWKASEMDIQLAAGLDFVAFLRVFVFSIKIFGISAFLCIFILLPINYFEEKWNPKNLAHIASESVDLFTIVHVPSGSKRLWAHFFALYTISGACCFLLYVEFRGIVARRQAWFDNSPPQANHFTILVRGIPLSNEDSPSTTVESFFRKYHPLTYLSHQMVYHVSKVDALMHDAEKLYKKIIHVKAKGSSEDKRSKEGCFGDNDAEKGEISVYTKKLEKLERKAREGCSEYFKEAKELPAAFVSFKSRYGAAIAAQIRQSHNPMLWVTEAAPKPQDVYWANLKIRPRELWFRYVVTILGSVGFTILFFIPVTFVQGLSQLERLQRYFPFLRKLLHTKFASQLITGYLPSVILQLFLYIVPPIMMVFSRMQGSISYSSRKKSACTKMVYFTIWNVFFVNVLSGSVINQLNNIISNPKRMPTELARVLPGQASFFTTYVLTSGWASLFAELIQLFSLLYNTFFKKKDAKCCASSFNFHTEIPKVLVFGLIGFTCSVLAPLILPFLLAYFIFGYIIYRNQALNVYQCKYDTGGQYWVIIHNVTVFSLILMQVIAMGVFGVKKVPIAAGLMLPLILITLLFNEYCRQRFSHMFKDFSAETLINRDREDEEKGVLESFFETLKDAYLYQTLKPVDLTEISIEEMEEASMVAERSLSTNCVNPPVMRLLLSKFQEISNWISVAVAYQKRRASS